MQEIWEFSTESWTIKVSICLVQWLCIYCLNNNVLLFYDYVMSWMVLFKPQFFCLSIQLWITVIWRRAVVTVVDDTLNSPFSVVQQYSNAKWIRCRSGDGWWHARDCAGASYCVTCPLFIEIIFSDLWSFKTQSVNLRSEQLRQLCDWINHFYLWLFLCCNCVFITLDRHIAVMIFFPVLQNLSKVCDRLKSHSRIVLVCITHLVWICW
jgi:hypothetical protein